ncbi:MAG: sulfurtransferase-like selenium metabolism protein YedF, partial [Deltaproteobacteria bacterium]|nr:sulfurtransferase-like selenium metabolism protein YedF [Deltaproteobacteria bacterium]
MPELDCRGLTCPQPVIKTKEALETISSGTVTVIVDNQAAKENVTRFAQSRGYQVTSTSTGNDHVLTVTKSGPETGHSPEVTCTAAPEKSRRVVVKISNQFMGQGSDELGRVLMKAFLSTLTKTTCASNDVNKGVGVPLNTVN